MSEQKSVGVVASATGGMVMSENKPHHRYSAHFKLWGTIVFCLLVVGGASYGAYYYEQHKSSNSSTNASAATAKKLPAYFSSLNAQEQVSYYLSQKNYTAALAIYNNHLKTAKTADEKAQANLGISTVYAAEQKYQLEYQYAQKAYADEATLETAVSLGGAAEDAGDKKSAVKYYQDAINLLPKQNMPADQSAYQLRVLQADIQEANQ